jgi:hypothetical protein
MDPQEGMILVRALVDNVTTLNATIMKDQVGECPLDRAKELIGMGYVEEATGAEVAIPGAGPLRPRGAAARDLAETMENREALRRERQVKKG